MIAQIVRPSVGARFLSQDVALDGVRARSSCFDGPASSKLAATLRYQRRHRRVG